MSVTVEIPDVLCRLTDEVRQLQVDASTVGDALALLWARFPKLQSRVLDSSGSLYPYLLITVNESAVQTDRVADFPVKTGDIIEIVALAEGG